MSEYNEGPFPAPSLKIRAKSGEVYDLVSLRRIHSNCKREDCLMQDLLDALEAACGIFKPVYGNKDCTFGYKTAIADVRQAAGVIET